MNEVALKLPDSIQHEQGSVLTLARIGFPWGPTRPSFSTYALSKMACPCLDPSTHRPFHRTRVDKVETKPYA